MRTAVRRLLLAALLLTLGCEQPEDRFVLQGSLVGLFGEPLAGAEVRLERDLSRDGLRCVPMTEVAHAVTDASGGYRFELIRQQITLGAPRQRTFRVESTNPDTLLVSSATFAFPSVDFVLPPLPVWQAPVPVEWITGAELLNEDYVDGVLAWRGPGNPGAEGRDAFTRTVTRQSGTLTITKDDFGGTEDVEVQVRFEEPLQRAGASGDAPKSRGMPCNVGPAGECPVTDGRFTPVKMPDGTRAIEITFAEEQTVDSIVLRGLVTDGVFTTVKVEWGADSTGAWNPYQSAKVDPLAEELARRSCEEPGVFLGPLYVPVGGFIRPRQVRLHFIDDDKNTRDILWLAEVSVW